MERRYEVRTHDQGFSLLEITVGLAIGSVALYALSGSFSLLSKLTSNQLAKQDLASEMSLIGATMGLEENCEANFKGAVFKSNRARDGFEELAFRKLVLKKDRRTFLEVNKKVGGSSTVSRISLSNLKEISDEFMTGDLQVTAVVGGGAKSTSQVVRRVPLFFEVNSVAGFRKVVTSCRSVQSGRVVAENPDPENPGGTTKGRTPTGRIASVRTIFQPGSRREIEFRVPVGITRIHAVGRSNWHADYGWESEDTSQIEIFVDLVEKKHSGINMHTGGSNHESTMGYVWNDAEFGKAISPVGDNHTGSYAAGVDNRTPKVHYNRTTKTVKVTGLLGGPMKTVWMIKFSE